MAQELLPFHDAPAVVAKQVATAARKVAKGVKLSYRKNEDSNSFTYSQSGFRLESDKLLLSKIGSIMIVLHRKLLSTSSR